MTKKTVSCIIKGSPRCRRENYRYSEGFVYLHEKDVSCSISASMYNKCLFLDVTASTWPDGQLAAILKT